MLRNCVKLLINIYLMLDSIKLTILFTYLFTGFAIDHLYNNEQ
jgi:hypothetical protein